jgi:hypothetical protein
VQIRQQSHPVVLLYCSGGGSQHITAWGQGAAQNAHDVHGSCHALKVYLKPRALSPAIQTQACYLGTKVCKKLPQPAAAIPAAPLHLQTFKK